MRYRTIPVLLVLISAMAVFAPIDSRRAYAQGYWDDVYVCEGINVSPAVPVMNADCRLYAENSVVEVDSTAYVGTYQGAHSATALSVADQSYQTLEVYAQIMFGSETHSQKNECHYDEGCELQGAALHMEPDWWAYVQ